jgi:hypothetical protein
VIEINAVDLTTRELTSVPAETVMKAYLTYIITAGIKALQVKRG